MAQFSKLASRALAICALALSLAASLASAQYPGSPVRRPAETTAEPKLRSTAVLEWIGEPGKPSASRIVPIAVWDGERYQAGGLYLAQPEPLAVMDETEYELDQAGVPQGLFVIFHPGQVNRNWFGYGAWRPLPPKKVAKLKPSKTPPAVVGQGDAGKASVAGNTDKSTAAKTSPDGNSPKKPGAAAGGASTTEADASQADPDRPTLHKRSTQDAGANSGNAGGREQSDGKRGDVDPDRPTLQKSRNNPAAAAAATTGERDPNRPTLHRGAPTIGDPALASSKLTGMPPNLQQMIAVSDPGSNAEHAFLFHWANPDDAVKMKVALEDIARKALASSGVTTTFGTAPVTNTHVRAGARHAPPKPSAPLAFSDEKFNVYELSYSGGATMILTARSGEGAAERDVTVIAQPDFYGVPHVLLQSVSDAAHLDTTPRMLFIDAVDTDGDNRAELIFELRGETDRQFAIYKVARGAAEQVFVTEPLPFGTTRN